MVGANASATDDMMNRRNFLAGLLASTAAVPLAKAAPFTGSMDSAGVILSEDMADALVFTFANPGPQSWVEDMFLARESIYETFYVPLNTMLPKGDWAARREPGVQLLEDPRDR
jgi:hypothetical protein